MAENSAEVATEVEKDEWSQNQQKLLELGLKKYPKDTPERWERIADDVTGKDKVYIIFTYYIYYIIYTVYHKFLLITLNRQLSHPFEL